MKQLKLKPTTKVLVSVGTLAVSALLLEMMLHTAGFLLLIVFFAVLLGQGAANVLKNYFRPEGI